MLSTVYLKSLRDERISLVGWSIGFALIVGWIVAFWPLIEESMSEFSTLLQNDFLQAFMGGADFTTPRGFLSAELFSFMLPVMVAVLAIGLGSGSIAGEEERGELTLPLVRPLPRRRLALEKAAAALTFVTLVVAVACLAAIVGVGIADMGVATGEIVRAMLGLMLFGWALAGIAFGLGAAFGRRRIAVAATAGLTVVVYLLATFADLIDGAGWMAEISPWYWAFGEDAFTDGVTWLSGLGLIALSAAAIAAGIWRFERRDLAA